MWLDCEIFAEYEAGDHYIVIGRVNEMSTPEWHTGHPLLYFKGQYRHLLELEAG
jgi:3-hydroxy-9,10-secoandrosta-1,3,5(10)-triene-9,17-dione monooxygenase reductase component